MNTNETINAAHSAAIHMLESNSFITAEDTVCAIKARSGAIYTGASHSNRNAHGGMGVHAEVEAVQNMLAAGETIVDEIVLIGTQSRMQMLPCNNCVNYILSLHPENQGCFILMPDRAINIQEVGMFAFHGVAAPEPQVFGGNAPQYGGHAGGAAFHGGARAPELPPAYENADSITANTDNSSNDFLKNKVSSLLSVADDDEEEFEEQPAKKKLFGFFRK